MKILVLSDSHGNVEAMARAVERFQPHHILLAMARREGTAAAELLQLSGHDPQMLFG